MHELSHSNSLLFPSFYLSAFLLLLPVSVWLSLSGFLFCPSLGLYCCFPPPPASLSASLSLFSLSDVYSYPSAPDCESALLWQFCCRALLTCMSCCIAMSSHHSKVLRVRAVLPQQRGNAERMLHRRCGQDYLKNLLRLILFFLIISAHAVPHNDSLQNIDSSHICLIILCCQC